MLRATRRRFRAPVWLVLAMVVGLPTLAQAQLFPNRTIKRQRETCAAENPFNAHVRKDYYGYYPTCWSKFPEGWGCPCPNPELPNAAASFTKRKRDDPPTDDRPLDGTDPDDRRMDRDPAPADPKMPAIPGTPGRSPFDINPDQPPTTPPPRGAAGAVRSNDNLSVPISRAPQTGTLDQLPSISAPSAMAEPSLPPGSIVMAPEATLASNTSPSRADVGPLPSAAMPSGSTPGDTEAVLGTPVPAGSTTTVPAQAPKRRSILGGLFGQGNKRVR